MKTCAKCGLEKPRSEYYKESRTKDGLSARCKVCHLAAVSSWRQNNIKYKEYHKEYRLKKRAALSAESGNTDAANRDKTNASKAAWRAANQEKQKMCVAAWHVANPDSARIYAHNRRARKREGGGKLSNGLAAKLFKLQRGKCACGCKQPLGDDYHLDHRMPLALGGTNTDDNMQLLRQRCNLSKGAKHPVEFMQSRGLLL